MLFMLTIIMLVIVVGLVANSRQEVDNENYAEYMLELDEEKKRKQ